jgi:hypothetical protein
MSDEKSKRSSTEARGSIPENKYNDKNNSIGKAVQTNIIK